jgi:hypothetical protein
MARRDTRTPHKFRLPYGKKKSVWFYTVMYFTSKAPMRLECGICGILVRCATALR